MTPLHADFLRLPLAHRALHDLAAGRPENSLSAIRAAIRAGYGIEIDLQPSADDVAMVFHDYQLERLTGEKGAIRLRDAADLAAIPLAGSTHGDTIPTLSQVLEVVAGQVPLLIELKDQDGAFGADVGALGRATAAALRGYKGPVAVMGFNPHSVADFAAHAPHIAVGLTTGEFLRRNWQLVPQARLKELAAIPDYDRIGASFISHRGTALGMARVGALKAHGAAILCWTIRSPEAEAEAREIADNVTFEGYLPPIPPA